MGGLADLLFFAVLLWFVFRAAGKAAGGMGQAPGESETDDGRPALDRRPPAPDRQPPRARPRSAEGSFRGRLMEELRRWEAEQRAGAEVSEAGWRRFETRRAGREAEPPGISAGRTEVPTRPAEPRARRTELDPWREEAEIPRAPVEATEAELEARSLEVEPPEPVPTETLPRRARREAGLEGLAAARLAETARTEAPPRPPAGSAGATALRRQRSARLPDLSRYTPIQRAVLWGEILGRPPGLRD